MPEPEVVLGNIARHYVKKNLNREEFLKLCGAIYDKAEDKWLREGI